MATTATETIPEPFLSAEQVFDVVGPAYEAAFEGLPEQAASIKWILSELDAAGTKRARTVDIGCGTGKPVCWALAEAGHDALGIDISAEMVKAARERVPAARFEQADVRDFSPPPASFDVATVYFSMIASVTQEEIRGFMAKIHGFLKPGGLFVFATVPIDADGIQIKWMGHPVQVSSLSPEAGVQAVRDAGFEVVYDAVTKFTPRAAEAGICKPEDVWEEPHLFVYAKKPVSA
ncbi:Demethylmenaquinone methyltransferase [Pleurostoma richardsiae]|uniref:Demethylmenaquinone methyltransferase n=1 Tax=Pleurostoma richardsiae TaxID=41990 RepID=A0AA38S6M6_9PEZI|nr:Demethylmenaquinone methyltransferase [Pleurostoma richardsiae]